MLAKGAPDEPWRELAELLWKLLDEVVVEEENPVVVELADRAISWGQTQRDGAPGAFPEVTNAHMGSLVRLLVERMRMQNLAEDLGRLDLLRTRRDNLQNPPRGSVDSLSHQTAQQEPCQRGLTLDGRLVLTVHPTESTRRTILEHVRRISHLVKGRRGLHGQARQALDASLKENLRALWRTPSQRINRPQVQDEVELGLFYVAETLFHTLPQAQTAINRVLLSHASSRLRWRIDSWIGGDRDGHPFVDAGVTAHALARHRQTALFLYRAPLETLEQVLSTGREFVQQPDILERWLAEAETAFTDVFNEIQTRYPEEPLRQMVALIRAKLEATARGEVRGYSTAHAFLQDVRQLGLFWDPDPRHWPTELQHLVAQIETFGFHLMTLDLRQHSRVQSEAVAEIIGAAFHTWTEENKIAALENLIANPRPWFPGSAATQDLRKTLEVAQEFRRASGADTVRRFLVSMAHAPSDILAVMSLMQAVDPELDLEVVPLIETRDDLQRATTMLDRLYDVPIWRKALEKRHNVQEIMLGYSDSTKDAGVFGASWEIYQAQRQLSQWGQNHHISIGFFHGRGGALGRGGGPTSLAILAQPPATINGVLRITQQGEVLSQKLLLPDMAFRSLELMLTAHATARLYPVPDIDPEAEAAVEAAARQSVEHYRSLIQAPQFWNYFLAVTPIREMSALNWGSRPSWREQFRFEDLRAIPWVFSWTQNRTGIPSWYGAGSALDHLIDQIGLTALQRLAKDWPFLSTLLHNLQLALIKADLQAASAYQQLAPHSLAGPFWQLIEEEHQRLKEALLTISDAPELLANQPRLRRAATWRNPQVDALNHLQIQMLSKYRESGDATLLPLLAQTMEGIALGVRNSG